MEDQKVEAMITEPVASVERVSVEITQVNMATGIGSNGMAMLLFDVPVTEVGMSPDMTIDLIKRLIVNVMQLGYPHPIELKIG